MYAQREKGHSIKSTDRKLPLERYSHSSWFLAHPTAIGIPRTLMNQNVPQETRSLKFSFYRPHLLNPYSPQGCTTTTANQFGRSLQV
jgi:hypothetical protein